MKTRLVGFILLFLATYFLMLNNALAASFPGTCTPNPTTLTLKTGTTAQVPYTCTDTTSYQLSFDTPSGLTVTPPTGYAPNPYPLTVTAGQTTGTFSVKIKTLYLGEGPHFSVPNQTPLTVIVTKPIITAGSLNCQSPIDLGQSSSCTITYTNSGNADATGVIISSPTAHTSTPTPCANNTIVKNGGTCTSTFTYTPTTTGTKTLTADFSATGINTIRKTTSVKVNPKPAPDVKATNYWCNPMSVNMNKTTTCTVTYTNKGNKNATRVSISASTYPIYGSIGPVLGSCGTSIKKNGGKCKAKFDYTAPGVPGVAHIQVHYSSNNGRYNLYNSMDVVVSQAAPKPPHKQSANIVTRGIFGCLYQYVKPGHSINCSITYTNKGTADAKGISIATSAPHGRAGTQTGCVTGPKSTLKKGKSCTATFTFYAPTKYDVCPPKLGSGSECKVTATYSYQGGADLVKSAKVWVLAIPPTPLVKIVDNLACPGCIIFPSTSCSCYITYKNTGTADAKRISIVTSAPHGRASTQKGCKSTLKKGKSCTATFTFHAPRSAHDCPPFQKGKYGTCKVTATFSYQGGENLVQSSSVSLIPSPPAYGKTRTVVPTSKTTPIFSEVVTNRDFIKSTKPNSSRFAGAFVFENNTVNNITGLRRVIYSIPRRFFRQNIRCNQVTNLPRYTACSSLKALPSGATCAACFIEKSGAKPRAKSYTFSGTLKYKGNSATASKTIITKPRYRQLTVKNYCSGPIWVAFSGDIAYRSCKHSSDCPVGTTCITGRCQVSTSSGGCKSVPGVCPQFSTCGLNGHCYWNRPTLSSGGVALKRGQQATYQIPNIAKNSANKTTVWQGSIAARTGCAIKNGVFSCITGNCGNTGKASACPIGQAPIQPVTQGKFSLQLKSKDSYHIDISNGFNIPTWIEPSGNPPFGKNMYDCTAAGRGSWNFEMVKGNELGSTLTANSQYKAYHSFVTNGGPSCGVADKYTCRQGVCGISQENVNASSPTLTCGNLIGFWSTLALCSANPSAYNAVLGCNNPSHTGSHAPTKLDWLRCSGQEGASCYAKGAKKNNCCGCPYWTLGASNYPYLLKIYHHIGLEVFTSYANNKSCQANTPYWIKHILLLDLIWMKRGNRSAKVFPQDTASSLFTCNSNKKIGSRKINKQNYIINFCASGSGTVSVGDTVNEMPVYIPPEPTSSRVHQESLLKRFMHKLEGYMSFVEHEVRKGFAAF